MKKLCLLLIIMAFVATSVMGQTSVKPFNIYAGGGLTLPTSPDGLKDGFKTGFHLNGGLGFKAMPKVEVVLGLDYHYLPADFENAIITLDSPDGGDVSVIMAGVDGKLNLGVPLTGINPFVQAGLGLAVLSMSDLTYGDGLGGTVTETEDAENKLYFQIGGGLEFQKFFIKIRYINISDAYGDEGSEEAASIIPITIGVKF